MEEKEEEEEINLTMFSQFGRKFISNYTTINISLEEGRGEKGKRKKIGREKKKYPNNQLEKNMEERKQEEKGKEE